MLKIGLLASGSLSDFRLKTLKPVVEDENFLIKFAVIDKRPGLKLHQKLKKNLKRGRGGYILIMALKSLLAKKEYSKPTVEYCQENHIDVIETDMPYSQEIIDQIKKYDVDVLILVGGFGIIKDSLLNVAPLGVLSYHHGDMRKYRGMPPALWELYNDEKEMGVTVQVLSKGLDRGLPIEEKSIAIKKNDTLQKLKKRALEESEEMLYKALIKLSNKSYKPCKIDAFGQVYTLPNLRQWVTLHFKLFWRKMFNNRSSS